LPNLRVPTPLSESSTTALNFTGERFTPEVRGAIGYEHLHRYCAVSRCARGARVLDAACGEGYGSAVLARVALEVTGVDVAPAAVEHAQARYAAPNLRFVAGSVTALPLADASVDLVVSFETIEHLAAQREMLAEFRRVLTPAGVLVISSPNRPVYSAQEGPENRYHVRELDRAEFAALLAVDFPVQAWHAQRVLAHSVLWTEGAVQGPVEYTLPDGTQREPAQPMYFLVVCGGREAALPILPALSLFDDGALTLWREFERAQKRERQLAWDELDARQVAEDRLAELVVAVNALAGERQRAAAQLDRADALFRELKRTHDEFVRVYAQCEQERADHAGTRARLAYRESVTGWLRWPLGLVRRRLAGVR
jgi:2-polyprenyl-3-methyl-5-hydroxy-6-metoxy-1,4-benzoquinol methylase